MGLGMGRGRDGGKMDVACEADDLIQNQQCTLRTIIAAILHYPSLRDAYNSCVYVQFTHLLSLPSLPALSLP